MSFFRCCVGGSRDPPTQAGPRAGTVAAARAKASKPAEVFFDVPKADPHLSAVTDPPGSGADAKRSKDSRDKGKFPFVRSFPVSRICGGGSAKRAKR